MDFNTWILEIRGLGMPKLGMEFSIHRFAQHGQHHIEHDLQHLQNTYKKPGGRPLAAHPFVDMSRNDANNALHHAGHAVQNHVLKNPCPNWTCPSHELKHLMYQQIIHLEISCINNSYIFNNMSKLGMPAMYQKLNRQRDPIWQVSLGVDRESLGGRADW